MADIFTETVQLAQRSAQESKSLRTLINNNVADLAALNTTAKDSLVSAINEVLAGGGATVSDTAYNEATWDSVTTEAPSKNAIRDKIEEMVALSQYNADALVIVDANGTDTERGTALVAAYAAAKLLTPEGGALSATNRVAVIIPPGKYYLPTGLALDTSFVDLFAMCPQQPSRRYATDAFVQEDPEPDANFRPPPTYLYTDGEAVHTVNQTAADVRMCGFGIAQLYAGTVSTAQIYGLRIGMSTEEANLPSIYRDMYFFSKSVSYASHRAGVGARKHLDGYWYNCHSGPMSWRSFGLVPKFRMKMWDCTFGGYSIGGDKPSGELESVYMVNCHEIDANPGGSFGGCGAYGIAIGAASTFIECSAGGNSFGLGMPVAGKFYRCIGGDSCFGATVTTVDIGEFSGYAEDCTAGGGSFGGTTQAGYGKCSGTLVRCKCEGNTVSTRIEGATIRDSRITATTTGIHALTLLDSNSEISNSDILVLEGGTGIPIYAASALNVSAYHCRMNNAANDADGLGANVTNLVTTPFNVVSPDATGPFLKSANNLSELANAGTARTNLELGSGNNVQFAAITGTTGSFSSTLSIQQDILCGSTIRLRNATNTGFAAIDAASISAQTSGAVTCYGFYIRAKADTCRVTFGTSDDVGLSRGGAANTLALGNGTAGSTTGTLLLTNLSSSGYIAGAEMTAPAAPAATGYRIFAEDNGAGKTRLMVVFATGAAQQIAIEP